METRDPLENIRASREYVKRRYGNLPDGWAEAGGYELGTTWAYKRPPLRRRIRTAWRVLLAR